ncbi:MAG: carbamoyl-phosphate synthase, large subunit [Gammaproteobacteria bacterium]|jgi:carbamoyl-phosphate synthase large subunit|nr:carbamoyl-phosphate synthase, large subunit [Gammaproteobacteria bacterium]
MPKREDIKKILLLGAGPIVIGQACEFDYSGVQACQALRTEGYEVILVNSNPATIMTDPSIADKTYITPIRSEVIAKIIAEERPDAILPTMGGQTALNCALDLARQGILEKYGVEMIGATREAIDKAEDRDLFRLAMQKIGLEVARSAIAYNLEEALQVQGQLGFPTVIRPSFTLGGTGGGIAYNREEFIEICECGFESSPGLLIEESLLGWKEFELEVVRDKNDNCIIVCTIENFDPMGVHTGDSITVAPAQTLTDKEYQVMRDAAMAILREIGVETGGSNVQFAVNPTDGRMIVIEMNPRVSRSSALASKATGFPIAKIAAKLAVGYTLDELANEIIQKAIPKEFPDATRRAAEYTHWYRSSETSAHQSRSLKVERYMPASFEPTIDYVVTKIPRFNFEKFPNADSRLTTQMKSVGEVMAIGHNFQESLQKAIRSLENGYDGLNSLISDEDEQWSEHLRYELKTPTADRLWYVADAFRQGLSLEEIALYTQIDPWFLGQIEDLILWEEKVRVQGLAGLDRDLLYSLKRRGFADSYLAKLLGVTETEVRQLRHDWDIRPVYKRIDSCAAEFASETAYFYSTYEQYCEARVENKPKVMVLGSGPNRIGQGIEFDYCCVHGAMAFSELGYQTIMVNCNPETVSTDFDRADRLYFEPLTLEDVLEICHKEQPNGVIVQLGGQTPLKLVEPLSTLGVPIWGSSADTIDWAEDRQRFQALLHSLGLKQPANVTATEINEAITKSRTLQYPLMIRPSYVLGGRGMQIITHEEELVGYLKKSPVISKDCPLLLEEFLDNAQEVDVDAVADGQNILVCGIMEHIEQAGVHSGDSSCCFPPFSLSIEIQQELRRQVTLIASEMQVIGLLNAQFAIQGDTIYVLEVNPRASRTVPFISKATGVAVTQIAACCMAGKSLAEMGYGESLAVPPYYSIKYPVFPFSRFGGVDPILGPEMKSTGEAMGIGEHFGEAFAYGFLGSQNKGQIPTKGQAFISVRDEDKAIVITIAKRLVEVGFSLCATRGTANALKEAGIDCKPINKYREGRPHIIDSIKNDEIDFIINTTDGQKSITDSYTIRSSALQHRVCYTTTLAGARALILAMGYQHEIKVSALQTLHAKKEVIV